MTSPFVRRRRLAAERGWWDSYGNTMSAYQRLYADVESGAATICGYNQISLPGLLQSPEFTWALIELDKAEGGELNSIPERTVEARRKRQQKAFRADGPSYEIILDEFVLRRPAVPASVMAAQPRHMVEILTRQPRFTVRVLPLEARLSPGRLPPSTYMIYTFPDPEDPPVIIVETTATHLIHTSPQEMARYERLHERLRSASLPALESISLLADTANALSERTEHKA